MKMQKFTFRGVLCCLLAICLISLLPAEASAAFAADSSVFDPQLAQEALHIAESCYMPAMQEAVLALSGYAQIALCNREREAEDSRHVAAYAVYARTVDDRADVIIAIRGTGAEEWKLNMALMPSGDYTLGYAENFALAAQDILDTQQAFFDSLQSPCILVTGHSRGAAVANVLGARLTDRFGPENVFVYTFATPATVRDTAGTYSNIFNVINPADIVTCLPLPQWGFGRYGTDLVLPIEEPSLQAAAREAYAGRTDQTGSFPETAGSIADTQALTEAMAALAPDVQSCYTVRHAFSHPGEAAEGEAGMTAGEFMLMVFEGSLFSQQDASGALLQLVQSENDFTPVLALFTSQAAAVGRVGITQMHMPAVYGAWLTAMAGQENGGN